MALGYTLHSIIRAKEELPINSVQEFSDADFKDMKALGAVREPTDAEIALYRLAHPAVAPSETPVVESRRKGRQKKDVVEQPAPAPQADGSGDPDVTDPDLL